MAERKKGKPKRDIWNESGLYGEYEGAPDPSYNRAAFKAAWEAATAEEIVKDESPQGILGVPMTATWDEIKSAFRKLMKTHHPDRGGDPEVCKKMIAAYAVLKARMA